MRKKWMRERLWIGRVVDCWEGHCGGEAGRRSGKVDADADAGLMRDSANSFVAKTFRSKGLAMSAIGETSNPLALCKASRTSQVSRNPFQPIPLTPFSPTQTLTLPRRKNPHFPPLHPSRTLLTSFTALITNGTPTGPNSGK